MQNKQKSQNVASKRLKITEAVARMCSVRKMFLKISQISQGNTCVRVSF